MKKFEAINILYDVLYKEKWNGYWDLVWCFENLIDLGFERNDILAYYYKTLLEYQFSKRYSDLKRIGNNYSIMDIIDGKASITYDEWNDLKEENWKLSTMNTEFNILLTECGINKDKLPIKLQDVFYVSHYYTNYLENSKVIG